MHQILKVVGYNKFNYKRADNPGTPRSSTGLGPGYRPFAGTCARRTPGKCRQFPPGTCGYSHRPGFPGGTPLPENILPPKAARRGCWIPAASFAAPQQRPCRLGVAEVQSRPLVVPLVPVLRARLPSGIYKVSLWCAKRWFCAECCRFSRISRGTALAKIPAEKQVSRRIAASLAT